MMKRNSQNDEAWLLEVQSKVKSFCRDYEVVYAVKARERSASFEIGCLHMLLKSYEKVGNLHPENLNEKGEFKYLTSPNGNPENFSWVRVTIHGNEFEIRQQVRIKSHWHEDIAFCPDIVVLKPDQKISGEKIADYAGGKRKFFFVTSDQVVAAHECKSLSPFPELLVSFVGMFEAAHGWFKPGSSKQYSDSTGDHLAPCMFIGGDSRPIQRKMIVALEKVFPINIVSGLHWSRFKLARENNEARYLIDTVVNTKPPHTAARRRRLIRPKP